MKKKVSAEQSNNELLNAWENGTEEAAEILYQRYLVRLIALIRSRMPKILSRRFDPEDIVHSAWRSFFVASRQGTIYVPDDGDLWPLLAVISIRKLNRQFASETTAHRNIYRESSLEMQSDFIQFISKEPTSLQALSAIESLHSISASLSEEHVRILNLTLKGYSQLEIAKQIDCSTRTVRRAIRAIQQQVIRDGVVQGDHSLLEIKTRPMVYRHSQPNHTTKLSKNFHPSFKYEEFILEKMIGQGGNGKVYVAKRISTGKRVAIKFLKKKFWHQEIYVQSLISESELMQSMNHPHILEHYGWGKTKHQAIFLVMKFIEADDLKQKIQSKPLSINEAINCTLQIANALSSAHQHGVIHGDVTPGNILQQDEQTYLLTDFGFARSKGHHGLVKLGGTLGFLAPEQIAFAFGQVDERTDVYGIGGLLFSLLTGCPPFSGADETEILSRILSSTRPLRFNASNSIPDELQKLIGDSLSLAQKDRPQTVATFCERLRMINIT